MSKTLQNKIIASVIDHDILKELLTIEMLTTDSQVGVQARTRLQEFDEMVNANIWAFYNKDAYRAYLESLGEAINDEHRTILIELQVLPYDKDFEDDKKTNEVINMGRGN